MSLKTGRRPPGDFWADFERGRGDSRTCRNSAVSCPSGNARNCGS